VPAYSIVVNLNKLKDLLTHFMTCSNGLADDSLLFECGKEAFGYCVIPTTSFSAHTLLTTMFFMMALKDLAQY